MHHCLCQPRQSTVRIRFQSDLINTDCFRPGTVRRSIGCLRQPDYLVNSRFLALRPDLAIGLPLSSPCVNTSGLNPPETAQLKSLISRSEITLSQIPLVVFWQLLQLFVDAGRPRKRLVSSFRVRHVCPESGERSQSMSCSLESTTRPNLEYRCPIQSWAMTRRRDAGCSAREVAERLAQKAKPPQQEVTRQAGTKQGQRVLWTRSGR